jgi:hypothetical protein
MSAPQGLMYFLKKADGAIYGPSDLNTLQGWAREGRVAPDDMISKDKDVWYPAPTLTDLEMNWLVHLSDGTQYGPIHLQALKELIEEGSLSADDLVTNRITEQTCSLRAAMAAASAPADHAPGSQAEPISQTETAEPESVRAATIETTPKASAPEAPPPAPAAAREEPASWRDLASRKDFLEREVVKWKKLYEQEHENFLQSAHDYEERIQGLKKSELAALTRAEQLERKLKESEDNYRVLRESLANDPTRPYAQQLVALIELHRDLAQRYDAVSRLLQEKNSEIADLLEARSQAEARVEEQLRHMRDIVERERKEADHARRRSLEIESDYMQLVQAYRELNEKFMQLRQEAAGAATDAAASPAHRKRH